MRLKDRVALVTGGGSGIGRAICLALGAEGARVGVLDLNEKSAQAAADELQAKGAKALGLKVDITQSAQARAVVQQATERLGPVDILVNNAGWDKAEPFIKSTEETWDKILAINLKGHIIMTRAVLDGMIARQRGKIVIISSDAGRTGSSGEVVYSAAKGGLLGFAKGLAREMARYQINVNVVCPGPTDTPLFTSIAKDAPGLSDALIKAIPFRRLGRPEDIAGAVVFLASDEAAFVTGQTISVSGGLTMI
jgi:2-hydroxycyclohexanecarboxyl-CoA dehydrogenase